MLQKIGKIILLALFCLGLALFQFSFISALTGIWQYLNLGVMFSIFILFLFGVKSALYFIIFFGFFLDMLSFRFFGFYTIILASSILAADFSLKTLLTNKSLYSFWASIVITVLFYNLLAAIFILFSNNFAEVFLLFTANFWQSLFYQAIWIMLVAALFFNFSISLIRKFKPFFLES